MNVSNSTDVAVYAFDDAFGGVERLTASFRTHSFDRHMHAEYVIAIVDNGAEAFKCRGENHVAPAGAIYTINPDEVHDGRGTDENGWTYRALYPSKAFIERALGAHKSPRYFVNLIWRDANTFALLASLHTLMQRSRCPLARDAAIITTFRRLFELNSRAPGAPVVRRGNPSQLNRVRDILHDRFSERHTLESLGAEVSLHPNYLLSAFRHHFGATPSKLLRARRLAMAKCMIGAGAPLKTIAQDTGFFDQAHFSRSFKRAFGISPSAYATCVASPGA